MKTEKFTLTNSNIDNTVSLLRKLGEAENAEKRMLLASCLSLEEILLNFQSHFGEEKSVRITIRKHFNDLQVFLRLPGESYNPIESKGEEESGFIIDSLGMSPEYCYFYGSNLVILSIKRNKSNLFGILLSVALGVLIGLLGVFLPENILTTCHKVVKAVSDAIFSVLKMASLPVIFLCVVYGIIGSGCVNSFKENGFRVLGIFFRTMLIGLLLASALSIAVFGISISDSSSDIPLVDTLLNTLFSILPDNIFSPFANGDNIKVIILGVIFGCAILSLDGKPMLIHQITCQLKDICSVVLGWAGKLIPTLIVVVLIDNIWSGNIGTDLISLWEIVALYCAVAIPMLLFMIFKVSRRLSIPFGTVAKTVLIPGLKGVASASSILCYYDMVDGLTNKLKIPESKVHFGIPLSVAFYQPVTILYAVLVLFFVSKTGMSVDAGWIFSFLLVTFVTSIAAVPVSGGSVSLLAILFSTLGVAGPMTAMAYPLFMLMDYPSTGFRVMTMMLQVASLENRDKIE